MSKNRRMESPTNIYHVMQRGNNKEPVFADNYDKRKLMRFMEEAIHKFKVEVYAYCIMKNHFHLLISVGFLDLSEFMKTFTQEYAVFYNWKYNRVGHVFQGRFRSECIDSERYFWTCMRYIHLNPVKAGCAAHIFDYPFSSAVEYGKNRPYLLHIKAYEMYQKRFLDEKAFLKLHHDFMADTYYDVEEDRLLYQKETLKYYQNKILLKYNLKDEKLVLDTPKYRNELKQILREKLKLSRVKIEKLVDIQK